MRTAAGTIDLTAVAAAANKHLRPTTDTHEQPGRRLHPRGLAHAWTTITMLAIMPRHACSARCGARRRSGTWRFRSTSCLPIRRVVNAQLCARSTSSHLRRTPTCGYVDNASALPTDPQDQKTKVSVNLITLEAQHSNPVHHNHDRQPGQPRHPSPHSVSMLAAVHTRTYGGVGGRCREAPPYPDSHSHKSAEDAIFRTPCNAPVMYCAGQQRNRTWKFHLFFGAAMSENRP